jgi:hypothetical protein
LAGQTEPEGAAGGAAGGAADGVREGVSEIKKGAPKEEVVEGAVGTGLTGCRTL